MPDRGLRARQALCGPAVERVARRRQNALLIVGRRIQSQERIGEIAIAIANAFFIIGGRRRSLGRKHRQRTDFALIEPDQQRHRCLSARGEGRDHLLGQHAPVDRAPGAIAHARRSIGQRLRIDAAQRPHVGCLQCSGQHLPRPLARGRSVHRLAEFGHRDHVAALDNRPREEAARQRRFEQVHHAQPASRFARDRHPGRIPAESRDIGLHPLQRRNLVEQAVIARHMLRRFCAQAGMGQPAEHAQPIVDRHDDHPALGKTLAVIHRVTARSAHQRAAVDPEKHRCLIRLGGRPDVERQAILAHRHRIAAID
ncbi:hypothetical protein D9M73_156830 [compost metagenome]